MNVAYNVLWVNLHICHILLCLFEILKMCLHLPNSVECLNSHILLTLCEFHNQKCLIVDGFFCLQLRIMTELEYEHSIKNECGIQCFMGELTHLPHFAVSFHISYTGKPSDILCSILCLVIHKIIQRLNKRLILWKK